jgi:hypothetical protein
VNNSLSDITHALIWLCLAIRNPKEGSISLSTGYLDCGHNERFVLRPVFRPTPNGAGCWYSLFNSAVIAVEPFAELLQDHSLDLDFNHMIQLSAVEYTVSAGSGLILMGSYGISKFARMRISLRLPSWKLSRLRGYRPLNLNSYDQKKQDWVGAPKWLPYWAQANFPLQCLGQMPRGGLPNGNGEVPIYKLLPRLQHLCKSELKAGLHLNAS